MFNKNKKAQMGDTVTWVVATIIIVVMLLFFVVGSSLLSETKKIQKYRNKITVLIPEEKLDSFMTKSIFTYLSIGDKRTSINFYKILEEEEESGKYSISLENRTLEIERELDNEK